MPTACLTRSGQAGGSGRSTIFKPTGSTPIIKKVEELSMAALMLLIATGFFVISVSFFLGALLLGWCWLKATWQFFLWANTTT